MFAFFFALRNIVSRKSSIVIILFIAFSISLLSVSNAVFDGTDSGMEQSFINSFTGNIVIRPKSEFQLSLFGDDTPVTGELADIPPLLPYKEIYDTVSEIEEITTVLPQISGFVALWPPNGRVWVNAFGVNASDYVPAMKSIHMISGSWFEKGQKGIMLSKGAVDWIREDSDWNEPIAVGDKMKVAFFDGAACTIRLLPITGIYEYEVDNASLDRIVIIDPDSFRELLELNSVSMDADIEPENTSLMDVGMDSFIDLFTVGDTEGVEAETQDFGTSSSETDTVQNAENSSVWSYLVCKVQDSADSAKIIRRLNRIFKKYDWPAEAVNWRSAAGGSVVMVFYLRFILNVGIILILLTGFIVIVNTLVVSAFSRITEIGTLRAIGAKRSFVMTQFFWETAILTIFAGFLGCCLGFVWNRLIQVAGIQLSNSLLIQLFGGTCVQSVMRSSNLIMCMAVSVFLTLIGWFYPMHIAMEVNPVVAIRGQS